MKFYDFCDHTYAHIYLGVTKRRIESLPNEQHAKNYAKFKAWLVFDNYILCQTWTPTCLYHGLVYQVLYSLGLDMLSGLDQI